MSLGACTLSTGFTRRVRRTAAVLTMTVAFISVDARFLYAETPLAASLARAARAAGQQPAGERGAAAPPAQHRASWAEKTAWAYLLAGGCIFIATSPGEKNADGSWSRDGKAEMAAGIGAVGISFALLRDILRR